MIFTAAAGMAAVSGLMASAGAAQKGLNEAKRLRAQNQARIKQMQDQFELSTQNLHNNNVSIKQNKMKNNIAIEENKLEAQDAFAQAFAGSGISGRSKDILDARLQGEVAKSHNQANQIAQQETDRQFLGLMRQSDGISKAIDDLPMFDSGANAANISMAGISAGISAFAGSYTGDFGLGGSSDVTSKAAFKDNFSSASNSKGFKGSYGGNYSNNSGSIVG